MEPFVDLTSLSHYSHDTKTRSVMSIYCDRLVYVQVVTNYRYYVAQMCTQEEACPLEYARLLMWRHESKWAQSKLIIKLKEKPRET